ncbi:hypothetical protein MMC25_002257 [Agyrium rufum]|nr:hypothetical protein [Agyrium rufum]
MKSALQLVCALAGAEAVVGAFVNDAQANVARGLKRFGGIAGSLKAREDIPMFITVTKTETVFPSSCTVEASATAIISSIPIPVTITTAPTTGSASGIPTVLTASSFSITTILNTPVSSQVSAMPMSSAPGILQPPMTIGNSTGVFASAPSGTVSAIAMTSTKIESMTTAESATSAAQSPASSTSVAPISAAGRAVVAHGAIMLPLLMTFGGVVFGLVL